MIKSKSVDLAIAWVLPSVGAVLFVTLQAFTFLNAYVKSGGTMQAMTFDEPALWGVSLYYGAWVGPPLLALVGQRATDRAMLVLGGTLLVLSTLGGVADGLRDGSHLVGLELLAVTLPGTVALIRSWRHVHAN